MGGDLTGFGLWLVPIAILGKLAPLLLLGGAIWFFRSNRGARMRFGSQGGVDQETVAELRAELDEVRRELSELQERVDFSERLLAQQSGAAPVERGPAS